MIGKTNVGGGGGSSSFTAYIQITTDPSASITAVNLAGDTYSGTADNTGSLTLTVHNPGTYTLTESYSGMTATGTVVVPDINQYYATTILTWNGELYDHGDEFSLYTGGWSLTSGSNGSLVKQDSKMVLALNGSGKFAFVQTAQINFDITQYHYVNISGYVTNSSASGTVVDFATNNTSLATVTLPVGTSAVNRTSQRITFPNISSLQIGQYNSVRISSCSLNIEKIWLS